MKEKIYLDIYREGPPALIIVGRNGAGKSTLTNTIFGKNVAKVGTKADVTSGVTKYILPQSGVEIYDTPGLGGLNEEGEKSLRDFLQLDIPIKKIKPIPADMIIYVFTYERLTRQEFEFFRDIDAVHKNRIIIVKNYKSEESEEDYKSNYREIQTRVGRNPICVDALNGENINELIQEIFRFLTTDKLKKFNESLEKRKRKARELTCMYTLKAASQVAVIRSESKRKIIEEIEFYKDLLNKKIIESYVDQARDEGILDLPRTDYTNGIIEDDAALRMGTGTLGGGLGMLIGLLGGPIGLALGGLLGVIFGAALPPQISRGGSPAVINIIAQGYGLSEIIEDSFNEPLMLLTRNEAQMKNWLKNNKRKIIGTLKEASIEAEFAIKDAALIEFLNHPNTIDPAIIEFELKPVIEDVFKK